MNDPYTDAAEHLIRSLQQTPIQQSGSMSAIRDEEFEAEWNRMREAHLREMLADTPINVSSFKDLKYYIDQTKKRETPFLAQVNDEAIAERDGRLARRAAGPVFAKKTKVRVSAKVPGWLAACAAEPPVGLTGRVIEMRDSTDDVEYTGMVLVRFNARPLGYLEGGTVDYYIPNDCLEAL